MISCSILEYLMMGLHEFHSSFWYENTSILMTGIFFLENFSIRSEKIYLVIFIEIQVPRFVELEALYSSIYFIVGVDIWGVSEK